MYRHLYDKTDPEEGVPYIPFWDETEAAMAFQEKDIPPVHRKDYKTRPYFETESGEDLYPGFTKRDYGWFDQGEYKTYKDGGLIGAGLTLLESRDNPHAGVETLFKRK